MLHPTPLHWWEKAQNSVSIFLILVIVSFWIAPLVETAGIWTASLLVAVVVVAVSVIIALITAPMAKSRVAEDAERGLFACSLQPGGSAAGSSRSSWSMGYAKIEGRNLTFQAKTGVSGPLAGPLKTFSELAPLDTSKPPAKASWRTFPPKGQVLALTTDKGPINVAATETSLQLLAAHLNSNGESRNRPV